MEPFFIGSLRGPPEDRGHEKLFRGLIPPTSSPSREGEGGEDEKFRVMSSELGVLNLKSAICNLKFMKVFSLTLPSNLSGPPDVDPFVRAPPISWPI